jgi:hypothetical protein
MSTAEELKNLITIRDLFSAQLTTEKLDEETKQQLHEVVNSITQRIYLILDALILEDTASKEVSLKKLEESKPNWFNDLCKTILRILVAKEIAQRVDVAKIFHVLWSF